GFTHVIGIFLNWVKKEELDIEQVRYQDILSFMKHCQKKGVSQRTIQHYLSVVKHHYDHLIEQGMREANPVNGIKVQGVKRKTLHHIFEPHELHAIYNSYQDESLKGKRNKVILSLLVYQGAKTEELVKLEVRDVKLKEGKIEIPGGAKSERRILKLEAHQIMELYDYVNNTRKEILAKSKQQTDKLFVSIEGGESFSSCMTRIMYWARRKNKLVVNAKQLRASVIVKWLKMYNLRKVQYLAGHRYISSTESYQQSEMQGLTEEVNKFHPLG
ncbi:MAG TPA: tyrosine-type recombinase/integrase, partial [Saprospiraceae bacterium]|nr:tyrosine-type recombinase/integrase [Saprospiraceae bacterium]